MMDRLVVSGSVMHRLMMDRWCVSLGRWHVGLQCVVYRGDQLIGPKHVKDITRFLRTVNDSRN